MANLSDVKVTIDVLKPSPRIGFGKPLILGASAAGHAYKNYYDLAGVLVDYPLTTEEYKAAAAIFAQGDDAPAEIAIVSRKTGTTPETLAGILPGLFSKDWYFLISTSAVLADLTAIADAVEADNSRQFFARSSGKTDLATLFAKGYTRTTVFFQTAGEVAKYPEAAWIGRAGSAPVGSLTWKAKALTGILPMDIDAAELATIHNLGANTYVTKAGSNVTSEGITVSGEYIDIIHARDYLVYSIQYAVQYRINHSPKIPYDDKGIAVLESEVRTVLKRADNQGMIAQDADGLPLYSTAFKSRAEVDPADRAAREYNDGTFEFELAGAIHQATIKGTIKL